MNLVLSDISWLTMTFPGLVYKPERNQIVGKLRFRAAFDRESGELKWGDIHDYTRMDTYLSDSFEIRIDLSSNGLGGWPKVYEIGGRCQEIAALNGCELIDLHLFADGACCVGLRLTSERGLTLQRYMCDLVLPFFYRLSYAGLFGLEAARENLWGEYAHGHTGEIEYIAELIRMGDTNPQLRGPCPCGSGKTYSQCHRAEVLAAQPYRAKE